MMKAVGETRRGRIASGLGLARWIVAASLALLAAGCNAIDPPAAPLASLAPAAAPQTTGGALVSPERKRLIDAFGGEYSAPATERYLNDILARLAPASETPTEPYRVTILDSPWSTRSPFPRATSSSPAACSRSPTTGRKSPR